MLAGASMVDAGSAGGSASCASAVSPAVASGKPVGSWAVVSCSSAGVVGTGLCSCPAVS